VGHWQKIHNDKNNTISKIFAIKKAAEKGGWLFGSPGGGAWFF